METGCQAIREALVEASGDPALLNDAERAHLAACARCAEVAAAEMQLGRIMVEAIPPADAELEARVMESIAAQRSPSRVLALLPVAASLLVVGSGAAMVGGIPGGRLIALLPAWSAQGWLALLAAVSDLGVVLTATAHATGAVLSPAARLAAAVLAVVGAGSLVAVTARWREAYQWRRNH